jgi:hypothetical protein
VGVFVAPVVGVLVGAGVLVAAGLVGVAVGLVVGLTVTVTFFVGVGVSSSSGSSVGVTSAVGVGVSIASVSSISEFVRVDENHKNPPIERTSIVIVVITISLRFGISLRRANIYVFYQTKQSS